MKNTLRFLFTLALLAGMAAGQNPTTPYTIINRVKPYAGQTTILFDSPLEIGGSASDPGTLRNGMIWYNSTGNALKARINGATVSLGAGGGGGSGTVTSVAASFTGGLVSVGGSPITADGTLAFSVAGTSGGIPYFSSASAWASTGALTANSPILGGGAGAAPKVLAGVTTDGTSQLQLGVAGTSLGSVRLAGSTSGTVTIQPNAAAGTSVTVTLPATSTKVPIAAQLLTFSGPTAARTITLPDSDFAAARTDGGQTFTGDQIFSGNDVKIEGGSLWLGSPTQQGGIAIYNSDGALSGLVLAETAAAGGLLKLPDGNGTLATVSGDLGTPSAITLTNATGLPIVAGTTGTLTVARGGTGLTALGTAGQILRVNAGATALEFATASGSGDVVGPASATDNAIARFDSTTGKLLQNSAATVADTTGDVTAGKFNGVTITGSGSVVQTLYKTNTVTIGNTTTETNIFSTTIPGGSLSTGNVIRFAIRGDILQNSGASRTFTIKVTYGGTTLYNGTSSALSVTTDRRPYVFEGTIAAAGATNSQTFTGCILVGSATAPTTGLGAITTTLPLMGAIGGSSSVDSTSAQTLAVTVTLSAASASYEFLNKSIVVELLN